MAGCLGRARVKVREGFALSPHRCKGDGPGSARHRLWGGQSRAGSVRAHAARTPLATHRVNAVLRSPSCNSHHLLHSHSQRPTGRRWGSWLIHQPLVHQLLLPSYSQGRPWWGGCGGREIFFYTVTATELTAASQSWGFPRSLRLPIGAGGEVPVWPPAAGQLSRGGGGSRGCPGPAGASLTQTSSTMPFW